MATRPRIVEKSMRIDDTLLVKGTLTAEAGLTGDITGDITGQVFGTVGTYDADGVIAITDTLVLLDGSTEALAMSLAVGSAGQRMILKCIDVTNDSVVTPAALFEGDTLTFDAANDVAELVCDGTTWYIVTNTSTLA